MVTSPPLPDSRKAPSSPGAPTWCGAPAHWAAPFRKETWRPRTVCNTTDQWWWPRRPWRRASVPASYSKEDTCSDALKVRTCRSLSSTLGRGWRGLCPMTTVCKRRKPRMRPHNLVWSLSIFVLMCPFWIQLDPHSSDWYYRIADFDCLVKMY